MSDKIEIRTATELVCSMELTNTSVRTGLAIKWNLTVGNRPKWCNRTKDTDMVHRRACEALEVLGVTAEHLKTIARAGAVEIRFPDASEKELWAHESYPWEHWICAATRDSSIVVVRHLAVKRKATTRKPKSFTFIESAPARFKRAKNFDSEREFVCAGLQPLGKGNILKDLSEDAFASEIAKAKPDIIHFASVDNLLGSQLDWGYEKEEMRYYKSIYNGAYFATTQEKYAIDLKHQKEVLWPKLRKKGEKVNETEDRLEFADGRQVDSRDVAKILNSASRKPLLVSLSAWYSNSRMASRCIAEGAGAVICFHNSIDEDIARLFWHHFYRALISLDFNICEAYVSANEEIRPFTDKVNGSAVILWTSESVIKNLSDSKSKPTGSEYTIPASLYPDPSSEDISDLVGVNVELPKFLNYSMLHNGRSILDKLELWFRFPYDTHSKSMPCAIRGIEVEVSLEIGPDSFPYQSLVELDCSTPEVDLANEACNRGCKILGGVSVPLISKLARDLTEAVQTSILVKIQWKGQILYKQTHAITLAPANEWKLDQKDTCWIPSFVQPRAPAVSKIIGSAQKYLRCIEDNPTASFDGYQSDDIAPQVRAVWTAIAFDYSLDYTEPPPSYRNNSQRLRTPCEVLSEKRGTCIDLALLFASCLEWIGIYPVLFVTEGHTFPGYWASDEDHTNFFEKQASLHGHQEEFDAARAGIGTQLPWVVGIDSFSMVQQQIHPEGGCNSEEECKQNSAAAPLRSLEATFLPKRKGFKSAADDSLQFFCPASQYSAEPLPSSGDPFYAMIDIQKAREYVTPLPIY